MDDSDTVDVVISVEDAEQSHMSEVVKSLKRAGLSVTQAMESIGVISGQIAKDKVKGLEGVKGVAHVERSRKIKIPPPDNEIQ
jgi:hypothetical protein